MKAFNSKHKFFIVVLACVAAVPTLNADLLRDGRQAFLNYDFELASELYEKYAKTLKKTSNTPGEELLEMYQRQLELAENSLENVQKIEIIDRLDVSAEEFLRYIKLPSNVGRLLDPEVSMLKSRGNQSDFVYSSESGDLMMWSECDDNGIEHIMQSEHLMDGSWEKPHKAGDILNNGGNARNPFLLTDGVTLYYSSDGEESMGGYDLFVATKDPVSGEYRQPLGLGFPFNSPFNEYLMAIDEDNGIGWWVSDRNQLDGMVSVYVFKTNDVRKNYKLDEEPEIVSLARLSDISLTQDPSEDYVAIRKEIDARASVIKNRSTAEFLFPLPGGRVARSMDDFSKSTAKKSMRTYLNACDELAQLNRQLAEFRKRYHDTDRRKSSSVALKNEILALEKKREQQMDALKQLRNAVVSAEMNK